MRNDIFTIEFNENNGTIKSLVLNDDPMQMNWLEGLFNWGQPVGTADGSGCSYCNWLAQAHYGNPRNNAWRAHC